MVISEMVCFVQRQGVRTLVTVTMAQLQKMFMKGRIAYFRTNSWAQILTAFDISRK